MRTEQEVLVTDLVHKNREHLIQRGAGLLRKDDQENAIGAAVFSQLLEGCLLTLVYTNSDGHQLCVLAWHFTNPSLN